MGRQLTISYQGWCCGADIVNQALRISHGNTGGCLVSTHIDIWVTVGFGLALLDTPTVASYLSWIEGGKFEKCPFGCTTGSISSPVWLLLQSLYSSTGLSTAPPLLQEACQNLDDAKNKPWNLNLVYLCHPTSYHFFYPLL